MSVGQSSAPGKNDILLRRRMIFASACVGHRGAAGKPLAFAEKLVDLVNRPRSVARRTARPERRFEAGVGGRLLPHPPTYQAPGLAGKVLKCGLEGLEPADEACAIDQAIGGGRRRGRGADCGPGRRPYGHQFVVGVEHVDTRARPLRCPAARQHDTVRGSKSWKEAERECKLFLAFMTHAGFGRDTAGAITRLRAATTMRRRRADSAGRKIRSAARHGSRATVASPTSPSMANRSATISTSASLLRLMAKSQSIDT